MSYLRRFLRDHRPSPAMVVASIALLVALGGTSIAAVGNVPLFSVGTPQLKSERGHLGEGEEPNAARSRLQAGPASEAAPGAQAVGGRPVGPQGPAGVAAPGFVAAVSSQTAAPP